MNELKIQGEYVLLLKEIIDDKTKGGVLLTQETKQKKKTRKPTAKLISVGPDSKCNIEVGKHVLFDPLQAKAAFDYRNETYMVTTSESILLEVQHPNLLN